MDRLPRVLDAFAILPPPPPPEGAPGGESAGLLPLVVAATLALGLGLLVGWALGGRRRRASASPSVVRIELWRNGEAVVLGYGRTPEDAHAAAEAHRARLRRARSRGAVVLIEPVTDAIVALRPVDEELPRHKAPAHDWPRARPVVTAARAGVSDPSP